MASHSPARAVVVITGILYALLGIILAGGGIWLVMLGGSAYYLFGGLGVLMTGALLVAGHRSALWVYAAVLAGTLIWAVSEIGFDWWPLAARGDIIFPLGLWLLTPWITRNLSSDTSSTKGTLPLWSAVGAGAVVLVIGLASSYHDIDGVVAAVNPQLVQPDTGGQPADDWQAYGRTQFGQRYSPLNQITPANVGNLKVAWTFRTGDLPGKNDPGETTFEVTPIKVRDTVYLCSPHQRLFAVDAKTGTLRWSYDPKVQDNPTFQHLTCRGVSYHETAVGDTNADGTPAPVDCPRTIFLPVNDGRMIAVNADTGKECESFAEHGTLDLLEGMGVKTAGFYEPTSPPIVSAKILVIGGSVIDNYSTAEPSGVVRGFDIHTGKLIWAWDPGAADENALPSATHTYTNNSVNSWMTASYDAKLGLGYLPMGNPTPDIWGGNRDALSERYSTALVALDINTGKRVWSYQTVHHDLWDMDLPSQPTLADIPTA
jgi:quinoprotein glucose dehydrogenase